MPVRSEPICRSALIDSQTLDLYAVSARQRNYAA